MQSYENLFDYARYDEIVAVETIKTIVAIEKTIASIKKVETQKIASLPLNVHHNSRESQDKILLLATHY